MSKKEKLVLTCFGILFSVIILYIAVFYNNTKILFIALLILLANSMLFAIMDIKKNIVYLMFLGTFFLFLLGRYFVYIFQGNYEKFSPELNETFLIIYLSLLCILAGAILSNYKKSKTVNILNTHILPQNNGIYVQTLSGAGYFITLLFNYLVELEKINIVRTYGYIGLFTQYTQQLPFFVYKLAVLNIAFFCIYLATFPPKKKTYSAMLFYVFYLLLSLLTGTRGNTMTGIFFLITYSVMRYFKKNVSPLFSSRVAKMTLLILGFVTIVFMGIYSQIRLGEKTIEKTNVLSGFLVEQGISIEVLAKSLEIKEDLREMNTNYSAYSVINYNRMTKNLYNIFVPITEHIYEEALYINNLGNNVTYFLDPIYYETGGRFGTQYLAELFLDYSYAGIILYNLCLGYLLVVLASVNYSNWIIYAYKFMIIKSLFFLARDSAFSWITSIMSLSNLLGIFVVLILGALLKRKFNGRRRLKNEIDVGT